ncbi:hypothetical protein [Actinomyces stomatis]|uniref:hypothetical protein n=1 Tax=Actinomyces stomatis TaxID=3050227 RepID=UPI0028528545|nr:hypothetical protein [Actinomyces sp. PK606]
MAKGRGRNHGESAGRRGSARRGAGSSSGRSSSGSQSRPLRQGGSGGPRSGGQSSSSRSGGAARSSQAKGRGGRASGAKSTGHPLHSGQTGRPAGGHSGKSSQAGKNRRPSQGAQGSSTARSRQAAPGTARSARTSSTQAARSDRRRNSWGKGIQWAHIGGGRLTGSPDSVPQGPDQPRSGRLRKPIPPQPRYGLRRALVLGGVLLILLILVVTIVVGYLWVRHTIRSQDEERAAAQVHTVYPTPGTCDPSTLSNTVQGPETVGVGAGATFSISLVNNGSVPCLLDVGSQALGVRVSSGSQQVWDSVTCPVGQTEKALLLPAGKAAEVSVTWNGNAATSDCAVANAAPASPASASASSTPSATGGSSASPSADQAQTAPGSTAGAGTYRFHFVMGGKDLTEDRVFVVG